LWLRAECDKAHRIPQRFGSSRIWASPAAAWRCSSLPAAPNETEKATHRAYETPHYRQGRELQSLLAGNEDSDALRQFWDFRERSEEDYFSVFNPRTRNCYWLVYRSVVQQAPIEITVLAAVCF
jgi:hypothetical protein